MIKFADDSETTRKIKNDDDCVHWGDTQFLFNWCDDSYLYLNVSKTKDMCIDFRKNRTDPKPVWIKRNVADRVSAHKDLGVIVDNKLCWNENVSCIIKKANTRLYRLRKEDILASITLLCWLFAGSSLSQFKTFLKTFIFTSAYSELL